MKFITYSSHQNHIFIIVFENKSYTLNANFGYIASWLYLDGSFSFMFDLYLGIANQNL